MQTLAPTDPLRWDLWCRVIDNHGDLGVCWRLARDLAGRGHAVRLWVDDPAALAWMAPQGWPGVELRRWDAAAIEVDVSVGDVVVEAFGCDPAPAFIARMAARQPAPVWINLEYLSAEAYVERSHRLASPQWHGPAAGLTKWFYYPGFTPATGGLLREPALAAERQAFGAPEAERFLAGAGVAPRADGSERRALLFCYEQPALPPWLERLAEAETESPWRLLLTPGHASRQVQVIARPAVHLLAHVSQPDFDRLLWSCDLNLVRGEDSLVRALWAGRPFVWQLYVQDDGAHADKLAAFLALYLDGAEAGLAALLRTAFAHWNGLLAPAAAEAAVAWRQLLGPRWQAWCDWAAQAAVRQMAQPALTDALLDFVAQRRVGLK
ncbi:MAG: elongation factor maturation arginine rhamnosyltransferase EarP [Pseudomonadota bacterium]